MGPKLQHMLFAFVVLVSCAGCGPTSNSEGLNAQDQLARIKKLEAQGKPLGAKQRELLEESRQNDASNSNESPSHAK